MNAWNINRFFLLLPIETDFRPINALWAYWDFPQMPPIASKSILCGKILSKNVIFHRINLCSKFPSTGPILGIYLGPGSRVRVQVSKYGFWLAQYQWDIRYLVHVLHKWMWIEIPRLDLALCVVSHFAKNTQIMFKNYKSGAKLSPSAVMICQSVRSTYVNCDLDAWLGAL